MTLHNRMKWAIGWPLLIIALFTHEPYREQLLAGQTIICCMTQEIWPFHTATIVCVIMYFAHQHVTINAAAIVLHHIIVTCAVASQYIEQRQYKRIIWVLMVWSTRWLGTISVFDSPLRTTLKFILFQGVSTGPWSANESNGLKWCWLLFVHEIMWCLLPIQILYEVYYYKKNQNAESIV